MIDRRLLLTGGGAAAVGAVTSTAVAADGSPALSPDGQGVRPGTQSGIHHITHPEGLAPGVGYSHVVWGTGPVVSIAGQVAFDESGKVVGPGDPAAQARQAFENLRRCLRAVSADFRDVLSLNIYVTDIAHMPAIRAARDRVIDPHRPPAATAVQVGALARPELLLEIQALALADAVTG
ncbi:RidA family protein [Streptomyces olindensis]|uniref:RidA family protein n=1 Tax=Streptomyces olindensis TaxID=358823 RepID=UPI00340FD8B2